MSIATLAARYGENVTLWRLGATTGSKKAFAQITSVQVFIQPMSATAAATAQLAFGRGFTGFVAPNTNVLIGDQLKDATGIKYDVQGTQNVNFGSRPFIQLTLQRQAQQGQL
jgi:hypothetical protein